jgi:outer membrane protein assembly factor BamB
MNSHGPRFATLLGISMILLASFTVRGAENDWPQWRGPLGTGVAPAGDPPTKWSETENVKWKVKLPGKGTSTPIVWGQYVFIHAAVPVAENAAAAHASPESAVVTPVLQQDQQPGGREGRRGQRGPGGGRGGFGGGGAPAGKYQFVLLCLDRQTGKTLWQKVVREEVPHEGHHRDHSFASYSPVTDGQHVFAFFGSRGLYCYDLQGNLKWQKDIGRMETKNDFGEGSSPALHGDTLVVNWDHEGDDFILALDKNTGKELWRTPRDEDTTWSTPLIVEHAGKAQVVVNATRKIRSYDLATGKQIWECGGMTSNAIPTPVAADGVVYVTSGFRGAALLAIKLGREGDLTGTDAVAWSHNKGTPYVPSPLLYGDRIYFLSGNNPLLSCFDVKTGKPLYETQRIDGPEGVYASPVGAADRVYLVGRNGATAVIKNAGTIDVLATNQLDDRIDASPAVAGSDLFLRGQQYLYCIAAP